jgi:hypothetical protein
MIRQDEGENKVPTTEQDVHIHRRNIANNLTPLERHNWHNSFDILPNISVRKRPM